MAVFADISISLDGFVAGPGPTLDEPLGRGGEALHKWALATAAWRGRHGLGGGEAGADSALIEETIARTGATIMGRRMFSGGRGPWEVDPRAGGWWGDEPPFAHPVFVLTHHAREPLTRGATTFSFVTDGVEAALERAVAAARGDDVAIAGGASAIRQYLTAGLVDDLQLHVAPVLLGAGVRLFDGGGGVATRELERALVISSPAVTHLRYRIDR